jgi:hypothetical protein
MYSIKVKDYLGDLAIDGRKILERIMKYDMREKTG